MRKLPEQTPRVETGPVQFYGDWTGLYLRGDDTFHLKAVLQDLLEYMAMSDPLIEESAKEFIAMIDKVIDINNEV